MILTCFFHQTLNRYFSYIRNKEKKFAKFGLWRSTVTLTVHHIKLVSHVPYNIKLSYISFRKPLLSLNDGNVWRQTSVNTLAAPTPYGTIDTIASTILRHVPLQKTETTHTKCGQKTETTHTERLARGFYSEKSSALKTWSCRIVEQFFLVCHTVLSVSSSRI